jgi:hypothetical protein
MNDNGEVENGEMENGEVETGEVDTGEVVDQMGHDNVVAIKELYLENKNLRDALKVLAFTVYERPLFMWVISCLRQVISDRLDSVLEVEGIQPKQKRKEKHAPKVFCCCFFCL